MGFSPEWVGKKPQPTWRHITSGIKLNKTYFTLWMLDFLCIYIEAIKRLWLLQLFETKTLQYSDTAILIEQR